MSGQYHDVRLAFPGDVLIRGTQIDEWAGVRLTQEQAQELEEAIPNSSIPEAIATIVHEALGISANEPEPGGYDAACRDAATRQGLDPLMDMLRTHDIQFELEQTGGFTMVVTVQANGKTLAMTNEGVCTRVGAFYDWAGHGDSARDYICRTFEEVRAIIRHEGRIP